jgi:hypothetical protein
MKAYGGVDVQIHVFLTSAVVGEEWSLTAKFAPTFADRGCHVVSVTDHYGHILGFL